MNERRVVTLGRAGNILLWVGAVIGMLSLLLAVATLVTGVQPLIVRSGSMEPTLGTGSLAVARSVDASKVVVGDVVSAVDAEGRRVTHRVTDIDTSGDLTALTLKGDANERPDAQPYLVDEVDRVLFDVPWLGYLASWVAGPWGMFLAGLLLAAIVMTFIRRPGHRGAHAAGAAAVLSVLGLLGTSVTSPVSTDAYFEDSARFEAGTIMAHSVEAFDWAATACTESGALGSTITLNYRVKDPRYTIVWDRYPLTGGSPTRIKAVSPPGSPGAAVATEFTGNDLSPGLAVAGTYRLVGSSKLKGSATQEWLSATKREARFTITGLGALSTVDCGTVNIGPSIAFTKPVGGDAFASESAANAAVRAACESLAAPCGTATDANGIKSVEYRLQRSNILGTQCWNPGAITSGFYLAGCGTWRSATTTPAVPTNVSTPVKWRVPLGNSTSAFQQYGSYTLFVRVTDNASPSVTTESTITFSRAL